MKVPFIASSLLGRAPGISHAFFTREGGVSGGIYASLNGGRGSNDDPDNVVENRRRMAETLGAAGDQLATPYQVHSADVAVASEPWDLGEAPRADGVVTTTRGLAIGIGTADCGPILFADPDAGVIGAAHAGWKGALGGVLEKTVEAMETLGASRGNMVAVLGPCIRQPSYEVGPEFLAAFRTANSDFVRFFTPAAADGKSRFDLGGFIMHRLQSAGIGQVEDTGLDTYADEARFYSYRRATHRGEPDYGRLIAAIALT